MEHIVFLTGRLAEPALRRVLCEIAPPGGDAPFAWEIREIGLQVAALMTADMIRRRVAAPVAAAPPSEGKCSSVRMAPSDSATALRST